MACATFTGHARKAMLFANWEALRFNHEYIGTAHLLLGLLRVRSGVACGALDGMGKDLCEIYAEIEKLIRPEPDKTVLGRLPRTPSVRRAIENAMEEVRFLGSAALGTGHLLLGLLEEHECIAACGLLNAGLNLQNIREAVLKQIKKQKETDDDFPDSGRLHEEKPSQSDAGSNQAASGGERSDQVNSREETEQTVQALWKEFKQNPENETLRSRLIEHYMPIVRYHAGCLHSKLPPEIEWDDIVSVGSFGLLNAVNAFDPSRGIKFETFCIPHIRGAMLGELRDRDWVPRLVRSRFRILDEARRFLEEKLGRHPTEEELAEFLEMPVEEVHRMIAQSHPDDRDDDNSVTGE